MIELEQVEAPLALFVEGLAGRYIHIKSLSEQHAATFDPLAARQSADAIYLPDSLPGMDRSAYLALALRQLGYREAGTFEFRIGEYCRRFDKPPPEVRPYGMPDRDSDFTQLFERYPNPAVARRLFLLLEDLRVDACVRRHYPGGARYLARVYRTRLATAAHSELRFDQLQRRVWGADTLTDLEHHFAPLLQSGNDVYTTAAALDVLYPRFHHDRDLLLDELNAEVSGAEWMQREARLEDWKQELDDLARQLLNIEMLDAEDALLEDSEGLGGTTRDTDQTLYSAKSERDSLARRVEMEKAALRHAVGQARGRARSFRYDEWNYLERRYLKRWCRLYEERIEPETGANVDELRAVIRTWRPQVKARLAQLKPLGLQRIYRVIDGDELDMNAVLSARQDIRAGMSPDERTYSRRDRVQRDVCAAFLVDLSASTDDPIDPPPPAAQEEDDEIPNLRDPFFEPPQSEPVPEPRKIIDIQREAMLVMASALDVLGDSFGIYGFSGYGRDCVEFFVAKEPDEALNARTLTAIASMAPKRSTRMGPAIRHASAKLAAAGQSMKLLIVISDGFPQDCDYGPARGEHEYGVQDTAKALLEAAAKGIETFCITVDRSGHDYLKRMCPDARYLVIDEIEALPDALTKVYATLTSS
ncbi:MAG: hypothetical protein R3E84_06825 [Pseudomonadales bacterium]